MDTRGNRAPGRAGESHGSDNRLARIENDLTHLKWLLGLNLALSLVLVARAFMV